MERHALCARLGLNDPGGSGSLLAALVASAARGDKGEVTDKGEVQDKGELQDTDVSHSTNDAFGRPGSAFQVITPQEAWLVSRRVFTDPTNQLGRNP